MHASALKDLIRIEYNTYGTSDNRNVWGEEIAGRSTPIWQQYSTSSLQAQIKDVSHSSYYVQEQDRISITHRINIRFKQDLFDLLKSSLGRVLEINRLDASQTERTFRIISLVNLKQKYWMLQLNCVEGEFAG